MIAPSGDPETAALVRTILDETSPGALKIACDHLHARLSTLGGLHDDSGHPDDVEPRQLPAGRALAPRDAARCVQDLARTSTFMRGVCAAVDEASRRCPDTIIDVLYAGCGPFAPLTLPLVLARDPGQVRITLIDAHARSLDIARAIYARLGMLSCVRAFVHDDAAAYTVDARWPPHVVICECMQRALTVEPQVAITRHLAAQLARQGILVPARITIDACLADVSQEFTLDAARPVARHRVPLGRVLDLTKDTRAPFHPVTVELPDAAPGLVLHLLTTVHVHGDLVLRDYDSGITYPLMLPQSPDARAVECSYQEGEAPRWRLREVDAR